MGKNKILLVDDDKEFLAEMGSALISSGYEVASVANGSMALQKTIDFKPDIIFLDIKLDGESGFIIADKLRKSYSAKDTPIVALTSVYTEKEYEYIAKGFGMRDRLIKPVGPDDLIRVIRRECEDGK